MPYLIDGNNLMYAIADAGADVGRQGLCKLLAVLAESDKSVHVVFDGSAPPAGMAGQIAELEVEVSYSSPRSADDVIADCISADTAPRRLTVVSSDNQVRAAARKRRCKKVNSEQFAVELLKLNAPRHDAPPREPTEKRDGLTDDQTRKWLREFGYDQ